MLLEETCLKCPRLAVPAARVANATDVAHCTCPAGTRPSHRILDVADDGTPLEERTFHLDNGNDPAQVCVLPHCPRSDSPDLRNATPSC